MIHELRRKLPALWLLPALILSPALAESNPLEKIPGYVDGSAFVELAGDDATTIEVSLHGALLKALAGIDPELSEIIGGLESIHAVVLEIEDSDTADRVRDLMSRTEKKLIGQKWERLARIKDGESVIKVLVLNDEKAIRGLTIMVAEFDEDQIVFVNIAGEIDLAALAKLGEQLDIPGLDQLGGE